MKTAENPRYSGLSLSISPYHNPTGKFKIYLDQFQSLYQIDPRTDCWEWIGYRKRGGKPCMNIWNGRTRKEDAKRLSYQHYVDMIPLQHLIVNTCGNSNCVNPNHLKAIPKNKQETDMKITSQNELEVAAGIRKELVETINEHGDEIGLYIRCNQGFTPDPDTPEGYRFNTTNKAFALNNALDILLDIFNKVNKKEEK